MINRLIDIACGICFAQFIHATSLADLMGMIVFGGLTISLFIIGGRDDDIR